MSETDADQTAEMPEQPRKVRGGTAEGPDATRQADTASTDPTGQPLVVTMEEVLSRPNMLKAYHRVVGNKGAPGIDGIPVEELGDLLRERWDAIREALLSGTYVPSAVRKVEIPKPGGKGVRMLGIPTVLDRLLQQALLQVLTPLFDPTFSESSFGFRPGRSAHQALDRAKARRADVASGSPHRRQTHPEADPPLSAGGDDGRRRDQSAIRRDAAGRPALTAAFERPARWVGPGTGAAGASFRPLRR